MKIFDIITPRRVALLALGAALAIVLLAVLWYPYGLFLLIVAVPLLLLALLLALRGRVGAWAGAVGGVAMAVWGVLFILLNLNTPDPLDATWMAISSFAALIGLLGFVSELPHLSLPSPAPAARPETGALRTAERHVTGPTWQLVPRQATFARVCSPIGPFPAGPGYPGQFARPGPAVVAGSLGGHRAWLCVTSYAA